MISLSLEAEAQLDALLTHYERLDRLRATENLLGAMERASERISRRPDAGLAAPRPYPSLAHLGFRWVKEGSYWIAYALRDAPAIVGVFHESADIPNRI